MARVGIQMGSRTDGEALKRSLEDPTINVTTRIAGALLELPTVAQRRAVINFVLATVAAHDNGQPEELAARGPGRLHLGDSGE